MRGMEMGMFIKVIMFAIILCTIDIQYLTAQKVDKIPIEISVQDENKDGGAGQKFFHFLKDIVASSNLYRESIGNERRITIIVIITKGFGVGEKGKAIAPVNLYYAISTSWVSNIEKDDEIIPIHIAHHVTICSQKYIKKVAENIIEATTSMKTCGYKENPNISQYIRWWP
jgi:hypothetical protein